MSIGFNSGYDSRLFLEHEVGHGHLLNDHLIGRAEKSRGRGVSKRCKKFAPDLRFEYVILNYFNVYVEARSLQFGLIQIIVDLRMQYAVYH
jgi:hypothetical protein